MESMDCDLESVSSVSCLSENPDEQIKWDDMTREQRYFIIQLIINKQMMPSELAEKIGKNRKNLSKIAERVRKGGSMTGTNGRPRLLDEKAWGNGVEFMAENVPVDKDEFGEVFKSLAVETFLRRYPGKVGAVGDEELPAPSKKSITRYLHRLNRSAREDAHHFVIIIIINIIIIIIHTDGMVSINPASYVEDRKVFARLEVYLRFNITCMRLNMSRDLVQGGA